MKIVEVDVQDSRQVNQFLALPFELYRDVPQWVPPMEPDAKGIFNRRKHPFYRYGQAVFLLAYEGGQPVGRLAALKNENYIRHNHDPAGFFYLFECADNPLAAVSLFENASDWARQNGLKRLIGPRGFTVFDGFGMLVDGFEHRPAFGLPYNLPYYPALVERAGFVLDSEILSGYLDARFDFPERIRRAAELVKQRRGLHIARFKSRRDIKKLIPFLKSLYNSSSTEGDGNIPLTDDDVKGLASQMLWFADPDLIKIVMKGDQPVGFLMAYPDISAAVQRTRGRIFPFGWIQLLLELKRTRWININGAGMLEGYRGLGGTAILFSEMYQSVSESRYQYADVVQIGADNDNMLREMRNFGIDFYKKHRVYRKELTQC